MFKICTSAEIYCTKCIQISIFQRESQHQISRNFSDLPQRLTIALINLVGLYSFFSSASDAAVLFCRIYKTKLIDGGANQWTGFFMMRTSVISVPSRVQDSWCGVQRANIRIYEIYFGLKSVLFILNVEIYKKNLLLIIFQGYF